MQLHLRSCNPSTRLEQSTNMLFLAKYLKGFLVMNA